MIPKFQYLLIGILLTVLFNINSVGQNESTLFLNKGDSLFNLKEWEQAVFHYDTAIVFYNKQQNWEKSLEVVSTIALCHYYENRNKDIIRRIDQSLPFFSQKGMGQTVPYVKLLTFKALAYKRLSDFERALKTYESALKIYETLDTTHSNVVYAYRNAAQIYTRRLNYSKALSYLIKGLENNPNGSDVPLIHSLIADNYLFLKQYDNALNHVLKGLKTVKSPVYKAHLLISEANIYLKQKRLKRAERKFFEVIDLAKANSDFRRFEVWKQYKSLADLYIIQNDFKKGITYYQIAIKEAEVYYRSKNRELAKLYTEFGHFQSKMKNTENALSHYQTAITQIFPNFNSQNISDNPPIEDVYPESWIMTSCARKGEALKYRYDQNGDISDLENAAECFDLSITGIEKLQQTYGSDAAKIYMSDYSFNYYEEAIEVNYLLFKERNNERYLHKIFELAEKSKATALTDAIQKIKAVIYADLPDTLLRKEEDLRLAIGDYEKILKQEGPDSLTFANIKSQLSDSRLEYERLIENLKNINPKFKALSESESVPTIADIREKLLINANFVIEFFEGEKAIYYLKIGKKNIEIEKIEKTESLEFHIKKFLQAFRKPEIISNDFSDFLKTGNHLLLGLFPNLTNSKHFENQKIIIIPDGILNYIPFDALAVDINPDEPKYFLNLMGIQIAYSATVLLAQRDLPIKNNGFLHFAPEDFLTRESALTPLKYGKEEVADLRNILSFYGKAALLHSFKNQSSDKGIIHLSTHAGGSENIPLIEFYDSTLYLPELYALNLSADLVVLSACETGLGKIERGEGVMSLARGFTYAGAKSLIASLWSVNERSTATIMSDFYGHLKKGKTKSEALRAAKLDYLTKATSETKKSPYYWAGFVFIGTDGAVDLNSGISPPAGAFFAAIILGILWFLIQRFRSS